jgi:hypothetical protein
MAFTNTEFAQMQGAEKHLPRMRFVQLQARNISNNTAYGMKWGKQASRVADARKSVPVESSFDAR